MDPKGIAKLEIDLWAMNSGDLRYTAGMLLKLAEDKDRAVEQVQEQEAAAVLARTKKPTPKEPEKNNEEG